MGDGASGLSDALRRMAEDDPPSAEAMDPPPPAELGEEPPGAAEAPSRPAARPAPTRGGHDSLKGLTAPLCAATAALLLIPASWAVLVLLGFDVWRSDRPGAARMAAAMLACGPVAAALFAGAWYTRGQLQRGGRARR